MESRIGNIHLSEEEEDELILEEDNLRSGDTFVDLCLVGRFLTDQPINFNLMRSRLAGIWRPGKGVFVKDIGQGRFIFQFFHPLDLQRIMDGGPWSFNNFPLIIHRLSRGEFPTRVELNRLAFWVQVHDLPAGYITEGIGKQLGAFIGEFLEYDATNSSSIWRQYMRIRVAIDVSKPLKRGRRIKKTDGTSFMVSFKYERLHIFCFVCGRVGHSERFCEDLFSSDPSNIKREWGVWLKADDRRGGPLTGDRWLRTGVESNRESDSTPPAARDRRGPEIFNFGSSHTRAESPQNVTPGNHGFIGKEIRGDEAAFMETDQRRDNRRGFDSGLITQKENIGITLGDERKRRREESTSASTPLAVLPNNTMYIEFPTPSENSSSSFLSAGPGSGAGRDQ